MKENNHPNKSIHQYDDNRADEMAKVVKQQYLNATDNVHRAVYAMEMFNIYIEQKMHEGLDCYIRICDCTVENTSGIYHWQYDPMQSDVVHRMRLDKHMIHGKLDDEWVYTPIEKLECFDKLWRIAFGDGSEVNILLTFENGKFSVKEEMVCTSDCIDIKRSCDDDLTMFHDGTFDPEKVSKFLTELTK